MLCGLLRAKILSAWLKGDSRLQVGHYLGIVPWGGQHLGLVSSMQKFRVLSTSTAS